MYEAATAIRLLGLCGCAGWIRYLGGFGSIRSHGDGLDSLRSNASFTTQHISTQISASSPYLIQPAIHLPFVAATTLFDRRLATRGGVYITYLEDVYGNRWGAGSSCA
ncbi:7159_t:CDS:1, partial [Acaulospora colombiana]